MTVASLRINEINYISRHVTFGHADSEESGSAGLTVPSRTRDPRNPGAPAFTVPSRTRDLSRERGRRKATAARSQAGFDVDRDDRLGANEATAEVGPALGAGGEAADELLGVAAGRRRAVARVGVDALAVREAQDDLERGSGVDLDLRVAHGLDDRGRDRDGLGRD